MRPWLAFGLCVPLFGCSTALLRPVATTEAATELQQVTRSSVNETNPAISPDGKAIVGGLFTQFAGTPRNRIARGAPAASSSAILPGVRRAQLRS